MRNARSMYQLPRFLKLAMYLSEIIIINVYFYFAFRKVLCPYSTGLFDISAVYGFVAMSLTVSYFAGVWVRPISFFYRSDRRGSILGNVLACLATMTMVFFVLSMMFRFTYLFQTIRFVYYLLATYATLASWRYICRKMIQTLRSKGKNAHRVVFVGSVDTIVELYNEMSHPIYGYHVDGYFSDEPIEGAPEGLKLLGPVCEVQDYVARETNLQQLYCSLPAVRAEEIRQIINACEHHCVRFYTIPQLRSYLKRRMQLEVLGSVPVLYMREDPLLSLSNRFVKRTFDIVVSGLFMIPFWLLIYPTIAIIGHFLQPGPVFFKQKRNGLNGEEFYCYKFRSMKVNADSDKVQATKDDPRKTPFGNFLRKTSIDELPQFINVLKGEMSIVGPRPHMVAHTEEYSKLIDKYMVRHWVRPGITGWAQVMGARGETKELWQMEDRIRKDIYYVENWSFSLDLKIMFLTVWNVIAGDKQAY